MKLFLASQDLGNFAEALQLMIGDKKRALVISNARDYYQDEGRIKESLTKTFVNLEKIGVTSERLDLREYFGDPDRLVERVSEYDPGLVFAIGGNVYCLATALATSSMYDIIQQGLERDAFVYGGYSAGSMIAMDDLSLYDVADYSKKPLRLSEVAKGVYGANPSFHGLGLIPQYILPHMDRADHIGAMKERLENIEHAGAKAILLNDADVYVVDGDKKEILKGE